MSNHPVPQTLSLAVPICDGVTLSDFVTPMEMLGIFNFPPENPLMNPKIMPIKYKFEIDYVAPEKKPVKSLSGFPHTAPTLNPTKTFEDVKKEGKQFDLIWVPAGPFPDLKTGKDLVHPSLYEFIRLQTTGCRYVCSVCAGSTLLAAAGVLDGREATTNKAGYRMLTTPFPSVKWVPKARWVVDTSSKPPIWTASGLTAGVDMALALIKEIYGEVEYEFVADSFEVNKVAGSGKDIFAEKIGLV